MTRTTDVPQFIECTRQLHSRYVQIAADLANGQQAFDLPIIALASTALSATAFNKKPDLVKRAGVAIITITGLRTYYNAEPRRLLIIQASTALNCVVQNSSDLEALDASRVTAWRTAYNGSATLSTQTSGDIQKYGRLVFSTQDRLEAAVFRIEDQLQLKLKSPAIPTVSNFTTDYDALVQKFKTSEQNAGDAAGHAAVTGAQTTSAAQKAFMKQVMTPDEQSQAAEHSAADLLLDKTLLESLDTLDTRLKACTDLMNG